MNEKVKLNTGKVKLNIEISPKVANFIMAGLVVQTATKSSRFNVMLEATCIAQNDFTTMTEAELTQLTDLMQSINDQLKYSPTN